jgi:signal transduction histidine kinase
VVKRGAYYLVLSGAVGILYVGAVLLFNVVLRAGALTESLAFPVVFTLAVLLFFNPIRGRLQAGVDRVFHRTRYDGAAVLARVGSELASTLDPERIAALVRRAVDGAIPNAGTRLFAGDPGSAEPREVGGRTSLPAGLAAPLAMGRVLAATGGLEPAATTAAEVHRDLAALGADAAVPFRHHGVVGALVVGAKRSGLPFSSRDVEFLRALAHQAAIALENARTYEALKELNASLEERVRERTRALEASNGDLANALRDLKAAQRQLVQSEKMASLGRLVAGVAHEINNPVTFIAGSVPALSRRLERAAEDAPAELVRVLDEAREIVGVMARGADRTAAIVKDLRTFSRLTESARKPSDLNDALEVSIRLLESHWRERITVHRRLTPLPPVDCDPGQINQVFMNMLTNACDAIADEGNIWVETGVDGPHVVVTIRDDGRGIAPAHLSRVFDPFFTTKDVGEGTGLGLAISQGVVAAHGGRVEVESTPGKGATFRVILPAAATAGSLDKLASGR